MGGVSSPQLDAATMDGVLLKRGKIVKSWKWRYFILNPEKKEVTKKRVVERSNVTVPLVIVKFSICIFTKDKKVNNNDASRQANDTIFLT